VIPLISESRLVKAQELIVGNSGHVTSHIQTCVNHMSTTVLNKQIKMPAKVIV